MHEKGGILPTTTTTAAAAAAAAAGHSAAQARHHRGLGLGLGREGTELTYVGGGSAVAADGLVRHFLSRSAYTHAHTVLSTPASSLPLSLKF